MSKIKRITEHLQSGRSITSREAFTDYGVTRLSAAVFDLRAKGMDIETEMVEGVDRYGEKTRYARYRLLK